MAVPATEEAMTTPRMLPRCSDPKNRGKRRGLQGTRGTAGGADRRAVQGSAPPGLTYGSTMIAAANIAIDATSSVRGRTGPPGFRSRGSRESGDRLEDEVGRSLNRGEALLSSGLPAPSAAPRGPVPVPSSVLALGGAYDTDDGDRPRIRGERQIGDGLTVVVVGADAVEQFCHLLVEGTVGSCCRGRSDAFERPVTQH
jgi:hypothetical protein